MSPLDLEYEDTPEQAVLEDVAYEDSAPLDPVDEGVQNFRALQAAFIESYSTGAPVVQSYQNAKLSGDPKAQLMKASQGMAQADNQALVEEFDDQLLNQPEVFPELAPAIINIQQKNNEKALDPTKQFVDAVAEPEVTEEVREAAANSVKLYELLKQSTDKLTTADYVMDVGAMFLPFRDTINEMQLFGGAVNNIDKMTNMIYNFKQLPYEQQQAIFPVIRDEFIEELGPLRGIDAVTKFIDPDTERELGDFSNWWKLFDVVDIASLGTAVTVKIANKIASFNVPKVLKKVENEKMAAEANVSAMVDEEAAEVMNISRETAAGNALPFDISIEDIGHTDQLSAPSIEAIKKTLGEIDETGARVLSGEGYLRFGILNNVERAEKEDLILNKLSKAKHESISVASRTENTTTFKYQVRDEDGAVGTEFFQLDLTLDDVGQWKQDQLPTLGELVTSPTVFARGLTRVDVDAAQIMDMQTAKVYKELSLLQLKAVAPLGNLLRPKNKKRLAEVNSVLLEGDKFLDETTGARGAVFDVDTLRGVYNLDEDQVHTYYSINRIYNHLWALRNNSKREEMVALGYKGIEAGDQTTFGKGFDTPAAAKQAMIEGKVSNIFDTTTGKQLSELSEEKLEQLYERGKVLVRTEDAFNAGEAGKYTHILIEAEGVTDLPTQVLPRKKGYIPRVSEGGHWFVKEYGSDLINGEPTANAFLRTHRYFDNQADAKKYAESLRAKEKALNPKLTDEQLSKKFKAEEDREKEIVATATGSFSHGGGGLYTGARSEDGILFGLNGDEGTRLNAFEALSRNISNVSRMVPINQWRLGLEQRWINTARALGVEVDGFGSLPESIESTRKGAFLNKMANQIRDWQGFPSREEQIYKATTQRLHEWALGKDLKTTSKLTGWLMDKDPISAARATAFHSLLGWFNPAQLWVQAQGMSVASSIAAGTRLTEVTRQTSGLTLLGAKGFDNTARTKWAAKAAGISVDELKYIHDLWKKTGYEDSVLQTADHAAAMKGHGIAMDALKSAADRGLVFYRGGELLSRRMAFTTALSEYREANKVTEISDDALKSIMTRTNNLLLNMTKANRAPFQKGLLSVPTQFFQVTAKTLESATGANRNFTPNEIGRIMAGQIALYGTAGIPLASMGVMYGMEALGFTQDDLDNNPVLVKTLNDGFWGFTALGVFGVDAEVSKRGSLLRGVTEQMDNWIFSDNDIGKLMLGAFGSTKNAFFDSLTKQLEPIWLSSANADAIDWIKLPTMPFLESVSTWRNVEKALFMQTMRELHSNSEDVSLRRDFSAIESLAKAIGFQLTDERKAWRLKEMEDAVKSVDQKTSDMILERMNEVATRDSLGLLDENYIKETREFYDAAYASLDYERQERVRKNVWNRILADSKEEMAISRYRTRLAGKAVDELTGISDWLTGTSMMTITSGDEE